jgi:hypothetical protein
MATGLARQCRRVATVALGVVCVMSCGTDDVATQPTTDAGSLFWALTLDHRAITLSTTAPYDTIQLTATPRNASGVALSGLGPVTFTSTDLARVQVSVDGAIQAIAPGSGILVIATLQAGNATHADTVIVSVTQDSAPSPIASLSIHIAAPDSAKIAMQTVESKFLPATSHDANGDSIADLIVDFRSSNREIATVDRRTGELRGILPGTVKITATATVYGVTRADTIAFTVGYPIKWGTFVVPVVTGGTIVDEFQPSEIRVGVGAIVSWSFDAGVTGTDVTFEDPSTIAEDTTDPPFFGGFTGAGNISATTECLDGLDLFSRLIACNRARVFTAPGTFEFRSTLTGVTGRVIVVDERVAQQP